MAPLTTRQAKKSDGQTRKGVGYPDLFASEESPKTPERIPTVAIVGRPNVGKSTLFNRIVGHRTAIVDDTPGVTRDRNTAQCEYQNRHFTLIDTGGLDLNAQEVMLEQIKHQTQLAIKEADIVIAVMDGRAGLSPLDADLAKLLRRVTKPVFLAVNKIDTPKFEPLLADFYQLGWDTVYPISAEGGIGVDELLEACFPFLPSMPEESVQPEWPRIAVVGRPNVGKSTLVNAILGEERLIVSDIPGTTRDPIDSVVLREERGYIFTDTAGLRRRGRVERGIEGYSVARAIRALGRSDVAVLLLDGVEGVTEQDTKIAGLINKQGRGCVLMVNKWDLRGADPNALPSYNLDLARRFPFFTHVPVVFASARQPTTLKKLFPLIDQVVEDFSKRVPTAKLNQLFQRVLEKHPITLKKGHPQKSFFMTQVATKPPTFALFMKNAQNVSAAYVRFLENSIRKEFGFVGTPLKLLIRSKSK